MKKCSRKLFEIKPFLACIEEDKGGEKVYYVMMTHHNSSVTRHKITKDTAFEMLVAYANGMPEIMDVFMEEDNFSGVYKITASLGIYRG
ncbi:hypothetical protein KAF80_01960 [Bacillus sp. WL1]|uniref:hypothetical protein n=1 Tax=Bacillus TaxID=1386 RepID=UPI001B329726|nr:MULTISPECIES: hypothetical protein [unclassified Bacillus (in: firmicutes)]MBP3967810.1 hypothetical protein [Bacillus sp. WL1]UOB78747.1 hypothetical protein MQW34_25510 [Bacillus sp. ZJS3]